MPPYRLSEWTTSSYWLLGGVASSGDGGGGGGGGGGYGGGGYGGEGYGGGGRDQLTMQSLGSQNGIYIKQDMNCLCYLRVWRRPFYSGLL